MTKFPQNNKLIINNNGLNAFEGFLSYTKNIDLTEQGYIKLSPPMGKIVTSEVAEGGDADFSLPVDIFSYGSGSYKVLTSAKSFNFVMAVLSPSEDTGIAQKATETSRVINWENGNWFINADAVYEYTGATGSTVYTSRIAVALEYIELFTNKNTLVGSNGDSILRQYNTSYASTTDLTIPDNFTITGAAYSNNMMGVITRGSKNQGNAFFFTWDGATTSANAGYPVADSYLIALESYRSSWAMMTSGGELLYFNGGGFQQLGTLPIFTFEDDLISLGANNSIDFGNIMDVDGDTIYINCASLPEFSSTNKPYRPGFSSGIYNYTPQTGLYHRFAPSYSRYRKENGTASSDVVTISSHRLETGDRIWLEADDLGLTKGIYYVIKLTSTTIKLASTYANALSSTAVSITDGTLNDLWYMNVSDYGVESVALRHLGVVKKLKDYEGTDESRAQPIFIGADIHPNDVSTTRVKVLNIAVPVMCNKGYATTTKFQTESMTDTWQGVGVKYMKLKQEDKIIVRGKTADEEPVIIGDMSLYAASYTGDTMIWDANGKEFETSADLSEVLAYSEVEEYEVYIYVGAGAGQSANIESIELHEDGVTYKVTLQEALRGITSNSKSLASIEKWVKLGEITSDDTLGYKVLPLAKPSPSLEIKLELRGVGTQVNEVQPLRRYNKPSTI